MSEATAGEGRPSPAFTMIKKIFEPGGWLSDLVQGYKFRSGQLDLALAVEASLTQNRHLLADAPTGTGKSLAYGIPAVIYSMVTGKRVLIVTANITLQEQLYRKDLPLIVDILHGKIRDNGKTLPDIEFALIKGMANYVCKDKLADLEDGRYGQDWFKEISAWARRSITGDKSELPKEYPPQIWREVSCTSDECTKASCDYAEECFALSSKNTGANVVITNYHMLYTDIMVREATKGRSATLPDYDVLVMDEAHEAVDIAQSFSGFELSRGRFEWIAKGLAKAKSDETPIAVEAIRRCTERFFERLQGTRDDDILQKPLGFDEGLVSALDAGRNVIAEAYRGVNEKDRSLPEKVRRTVSRLRMLSGSMVKVAAELESVAFGVVQEDKKMRLPRGKVFYIEKDRESGTKVCCKAVKVQTYLQENIFSRKAVIAVSATLASSDGFKFVSGEMGLQPSQFDSIRIGSPFDPSRMLVVVPADAPEVKQRDLHMEYVANLVADVAARLGGTTMALFTSHKALRLASEKMIRRRIPDLLVLTQGEMPKSRIIETFKATKHAVILGTASFWQGVDIPGQALSCLIIDKLPFLPPNDPVLRYMEEELDQVGKSAFHEYSIPKAVIALKQGVGRLIRTETDYGVVVLCDNRVDTVGYGKQFRKSFPNGHYRSNQTSDVKHFLDEMALK